MSKRGRNIKKDVRLKILKNQGVDYIDQNMHFYCRHCEDPIYYQDVYYAERHVK